MALVVDHGFDFIDVNTLSNLMKMRQSKIRERKWRKREIGRGNDYILI